jgi:hypothetical protein
VRTGATFDDAAAEWLRYIEHDRKRKPSTLAGYRAVLRSLLLTAFGELPVPARRRGWSRPVMSPFCCGRGAAGGTSGRAGEQVDGVQRDRRASRLRPAIHEPDQPGAALVGGALEARSLGGLEA